MESQILGIPMVAIVTSHARSLRDPTQQDFINAHTLPIYMCHMRLKLKCAHPTHIYVSHATQILKNPPEYTMQNRVQSGRNTKNDSHAHL